ncbi:unnamed protein product [Gongylonema pulchrum]|uniref:MCM OB domain-containing protein n=1 Tax=Gongylonema pulchrum TaxID=637853 RepID=A0A3P7NST9_9BILA|nr:unnamed protein product [Gongylonema pulchrum]
MVLFFSEIDLERPYYLERLYEIDQSESIAFNDIIPYLDLTVNEIFAEKYQKVLYSPIEVRPFNAEKTRNMRALNPGDVDQLITISGMVTRKSPPIPEMRQAYFQCNTCNFSLIHNRSLFMDKQIVKLQESPDDMPAGQTPYTVTLFAHGDLVERVQPGDRVSVTGIYRALPARINPRIRTVSSVYRASIDVLHFRKTDQSRLHQLDDG